MSEIEDLIEAEWEAYFRGLQRLEVGSEARGNFIRETMQRVDDYHRKLAPSKGYVGAVDIIGRLYFEVLERHTSMEIKQRYSS